MRMCLCLLLPLIVGCTTTQNSSTTDGAQLDLKLQSNPQRKKITTEERIALREKLEVFYYGTPASWRQARKEILQYGPLGTEILCLFMIKFFGAGRQDKPIQAGDEIGEYWVRARKELVTLGAKAVPYLLIAMAHPKIGSSGRLQCSLVLSQIGRPAVPLLLKNLHNGPEKFRFMVLQTLGSIGDKRAVPEIVELYRQQPLPQANNHGPLDDDPSFGIRYYCIKSLKLIVCKQALPAINAALDDPAVMVRKQAVEAATKLNFTEAIPTLEKALQVSKSVGIGYQRKLQAQLQQLSTASW